MTSASTNPWTRPGSTVLLARRVKVYNQSHVRWHHSQPITALNWRQSLDTILDCWWHAEWRYTANHVSDDILSTNHNSWLMSIIRLDTVLQPCWLAKWRYTTNHMSDDITFNQSLPRKIKSSYSAESETVLICYLTYPPLIQVCQLDFVEPAKATISITWPLYVCRPFVHHELIS